MKRNMIYFILTALLMTSFISFGDSTDMVQVCEGLLVKRAEAWNNIFDERYSYSNFYNDMNNIAAGELLKEDLETFLYLKQNPTSFERVISVRFDDREIKREKDKAYLTGKVIWELEGESGVEVLENDYSIELEKNKQNWYITKFEPIE